MSEKRELVLTFELDHPPEKVWRALTEPQLLARWLMQTDLVPVVGQHFQFKRDPLPHWDGTVNCEILEIEELRTISYTWRALGLDTVVTWTLERTSTGTRLVLVQAGFEADQKQALGGARGGWKSMAGEALPRVLAEIPQDTSEKEPFS